MTNGEPKSAASTLEVQSVSYVPEELGAVDTTVTDISYDPHFLDGFGDAPTPNVESMVEDLCDYADARDHQGRSWYAYREDLEMQEIYYDL